MPVTYFEHYPHYMGNKNACIKFTDAEFSKLVEMAKQFIKTKDDGDLDSLTNYVYVLEDKYGQTMYAIVNALTNNGDSPRRPQTIVSHLAKKGIYSGEWEEGSFAFSTKGKRDAQAAIARIEAKHMFDD